MFLVMPDRKAGRWRCRMGRNLLVAQSGGPTAAINATLAGVIEQALKYGKGHTEETIDKIYGAAYGIQGVLKEDFIDLAAKLGELAREEEFRDLTGQAGEPVREKSGEHPAAEQQTADGTDLRTVLTVLSRTPAAALGSCRFKLQDPEKDPSEFERIIEIFKKYNIGFFVYIGGNDSMDTVWKLSVYIRKQGIRDITVIGAPKTIDNDLYGIDHCPGFGSAAKYIATSCAELERELEVYDTPYVIIVEMMGRNAGWLTAAAALAAGQNSQVPYLIYLEEKAFDMNAFIGDVRGELKSGKSLIVAVSEGIRDRSGKMICAYETKAQSRDAFGHIIASGAGKVLEETVQSNIGCKTRYIELNLLQRCAGHLLSRTDVLESMELGRNAVRLAVSGSNGSMSSLRRLPGAGYQVVYEASDLSEIANREKKVPLEWISSEGNGVTQECIDYLRPLVAGEMSCAFAGGVPKYVVLK